MKITLLTDEIYGAIYFDNNKVAEGKLEYMSDDIFYILRMLAKKHPSMKICDLEWETTGIVLGDDEYLVEFPKTLKGE